MNIERLSNSFFKSIPDPAILLDLEARIYDCNDAFISLSGSDYSRVKDSSFWDLVSLEAKTLEHGQELEANWDEKIKLVFNVVKLKNSNQHIGYALIASKPGVSVNHFQKSRYEALGVLSSGVAHDLNNILTAVLGHVSFLKMSESDPDSLKAIEDGARKAAALSMQILDYAKGRNLEVKEVDLIELCSSAINLIQATISDKSKIEFIKPKSDIFVLGEKSQLSQLLLNLLVNAREAFKNEQGLVQVSLSSKQVNEPQIVNKQELAPGLYASLIVRDNGIGMKPETISRIFEPFFSSKKRKKNSSGGTGIGMATVASIISSHRGAILVESEFGIGSSFEVLLPLVSKEEQVNKKKIAPSSASKQAVVKGKERILIVDDEQTVRIVMEKSLEHLGYVVVVAEDGLEALSIFEKDQDFDLVILDMIMPNLSGDELFYKLREIRSDLKILIASGYSSDARTSAILNDGAVGFIQKPFAVEELSAEVRSAIDNN